MKWTLALVLIGLSAQLYGGDGTPGKASVLKGKVVDYSNAEALPGATIELVELGLVTYAGFDGSFEFSGISSGTYTLKVSYVSYGEQVAECAIQAQESFERIALKSL